jgi:hypothetical protein
MITACVQKWKVSVIYAGRSGGRWSSVEPFDSSEFKSTLTEIDKGVGNTRINQSLDEGSRGCIDHDCETVGEDADAWGM